MNYKKLCATLLFFLLFICNNIYSFNINKEPLTNPFPSEENLNSFIRETNIQSYNEEELDKLKISLITITPGDPIYSWFGHSAIMIEQEQKVSIIYDYGIFSFNSDNFIENFMLGKMYYILLPSNSETRFAGAIEENRAISKIEIDLTNEKKLDIVNFLNYNAKEENRTYLYDFYLDNCATRIRDIFNWLSDDEFKQWALNEYSAHSFRILSSKELSKSYFINWCLNSFLGPSCDMNNTMWENMFLPEYLEKAVLEFEGFKTNEVIINKNENTSKFNSFSKFKNHILFYTIFSLALALISLFLKTKKQDQNLRLYGILNIVINLFLLIIAFAITFFVFFSNITATFNNENLFFLNPIISLLLFVSSFLTLSKKDNSNIKMITYEKICAVYSIYLLGFILAKSIFPNVLSQQNYIILLPLFIYFSFQGLLLRTKN